MGNGTIIFTESFCICFLPMLGLAKKTLTSPWFVDSFFTAAKKRKGNPWVVNQSLFNEMI